MKSALAILGETGRTDFTVLEVVERSKTSLRAFYQLFATKDELLLALIDKIMAESTQRWREETTSLDAVAALRVLIDRISAPAHSSTQEGINRGLTFYNDHLAETLPREYARVLAPLHRLDRRHPQARYRRGGFPVRSRRRHHVRADHAVLTRRHAPARPRRRIERCPGRRDAHLRVLHARAHRRPTRGLTVAAVPVKRVSADENVLSQRSPGAARFPRYRRGNVVTTCQPNETSRSRRQVRHHVSQEWYRM